MRPSRQSGNEQADHREELPLLERLWQKGHWFVAQVSGALELLVVGGDQDHGYTAAQRAQLRQELEPAHPGQQQVQDQDPGDSLPESAKKILRAVEPGDIAVPRRPEQPGQGPAHGGVVVDDIDGELVLFHIRSLSCIDREPGPTPVKGSRRPSPAPAVPGTGPGHESYLFNTFLAWEIKVTGSIRRKKG